MSNPNFDSRYTKKSNNLSDIADAATARTNLGLSTVAATGSYNDLLNKPANTSASSITGFGPGDAGFVGWTIDPILATTNVSVASGNLVVFKFKTVKDSVLSSATLSIYTANTGITSSFAGIYDANLNLLGQTADQGASWNTAGVKTVSLTTPTVSQPAGTILYAALLAVGGAVTYRCAATALTFNSFSLNGVRLGVLSGQTVLPSSIVAANLSAYSSPIPFAVA